MCVVEGCNRPVHNKMRGLCHLHYRRFQRYGDPLGGRTMLGEPMQYLRSLLGVTHDECIPWPYARLTSGHGSVTIDGKTMTAARALCIMDKGEPAAPGLEAAHTCGNGHLGCVNRNHIYWATHRENYFDRVEHGVGQRGERHGLSKLTAETVRAIRSDNSAGDRIMDIAKRYGISRQAVGDVIYRRRWQWLD